MAKSKSKNEHRIVSLLIVACGLLYVFAYQFRLPFEADTFLYGMVGGLAVLVILTQRVALPKQGVLFLLVALVSLFGWSYTTMPEEGQREAILFVFFAGVFILSYANTGLIKTFTKWIYLCSIVVALSSIVQFLLPMPFAWFLSLLAKKEAYHQFAWSYVIDNAYAGIAAYTANTTFSAAIVCGYSFLNIVGKNEQPVIKNKVLNIILLALSLFAIILCSKRGVFVATLVALVVLLFYLYRGKGFVLKFCGAAAVMALTLAILYQANDTVAAFLNRFVGDDITTGRDEIYKTIIEASVTAVCWSVWEPARPTRLRNRVPITFICRFCTITDCSFLSLTSLFWRTTITAPSK